jgi:hypothetical protein
MGTAPMAARRAVKPCPMPCAPWQQKRGYKNCGIASIVATRTTRIHTYIYIEREWYATRSPKIRGFKHFFDLFFLKKNIF